MDRRRFLKRFSIGVLACSMLRDALLAPIMKSVPFTATQALSQYKAANRFYDLDGIYGVGIADVLRDFQSEINETYLRRVK